jgi:para-nitrobenzyl esterase
MDSLLNTLAENRAPTELEKCLIVWESLVNVGDPELEAIGDWNTGSCVRFDLLQEQKNIQSRLIAEFGSVSVTD